MKKQTKKQTKNNPISKIGAWFGSRQTNFTKDGENIAVDSTKLDIIISALIVSVIINMFFFSCWLVWQETTIAGRSQIISLLFN